MLSNELFYLCIEKYSIYKYSGILIQDLPRGVLRLCCRDYLYHLFTIDKETLEWAVEKGFTPVFDYALERSKAFYFRKNGVPDDISRTKSPD